MKKFVSILTALVLLTLVSCNTSDKVAKKQHHKTQVDLALPVRKSLNLQLFLATSLEP